jgi:hypothetical protein
MDGATMGNLRVGKASYFSGFIPASAYLQTRKEACLIVSCNLGIGARARTPSPRGLDWLNSLLRWLFELITLRPSQNKTLAQGFLPLE